MRIVASLLFFTVFILGYLFVAKQTTQDVQPASFLPQDSIFYAEQRDGIEALENFKNSRLGETIQSIDLLQILQDIEMDESVLELTANLIETIKKLQVDQLVHEVVGRKCVIGMIPSRSWSDSTGTAKQYIKSHLLLISEPRISAAALDLLTTYYTGNIKMSVVPYGEYTIKRFELPDDTVSVAFADGYLLASTEERTLREALNLRDRGDESLQAVTEFKRLSEEMSGAERMFYLSVDGLRSLADYAADHSQSEKERAVLTEFSDMKGFNIAGYGAWRGDEVLQDRLVVTMNREVLQPSIQQMLETAPTTNDTLPFISNDSLVYYWSNTLNIRLLWDMYVAEAGEDDSDIERFREEVQELTNMGLEDILDLVSSKVSFVLRKSDHAQFVPIPDFALLLHLNDSTQIEQILTRLFVKLDIGIQNRKYREINYNYWGLYPQESLQPVYTFHRDYLIVSNTLDIFKKIIDTPITESALHASEKFSEIDPGFQKNNNSVFYIDQATFVAQLRELISWAGAMIAIQDRQMAAKSKILIDNLINPVLHGLAMYEKSATRTHIEDDRIVVESRTRLIR